MVRLLTGADGRDAMGRPVGIKPGQDIEAAVLGGCEQVWRYLLRDLHSRFRDQAIGK